LPGPFPSYAPLCRIRELRPAARFTLDGRPDDPGLGGAINLAATDTAPELLLSDGLVEDQLSQDPATVRKARATFSGVRADALNRADSRSALMEAMDRWSD
jgi:hypothetical protein